jgi:hypothetical protein
MKAKKTLGIGLLALGLISFFDVRFFGGVSLLFGLIMVATGTVILVRQSSIAERVKGLLGSSRSREQPAPPKTPTADHLLPVRVLKLAESRGGVLTVSAVAMSLDVELDAAEWALDELVRKGAACVDVDIATGVASYSFPEFLPRPIQGPLET